MRERTDADLPELSLAGLTRLLRLMKSFKDRTNAAPLKMAFWGFVKPTQELTNEVMNENHATVPARCTSAACMAGHLVLNEGAKFLLTSLYKDENGIVEVYRCMPKNSSQSRDIQAYACELLFGRSYVDFENTRKYPFSPGSDFWTDEDGSDLDENNPRDVVKFIQNVIRYFGVQGMSSIELEARIAAMR